MANNGIDYVIEVYGANENSLGDFELLIKAFEDGMSSVSPSKSPKGSKGSKVDKDNWKTNFNTYKTNLDDSISALLLDDKFMKQMSDTYPKIDVAMTIRKAVDTYWGTIEGWKNKRKKRNIPDWKKTMINALSMGFNQVPKRTAVQSRGFIL